MKSLGTIKVCTTCMLVHANGVDIRYESDHGMEYDPETNPSPEPTPWGIEPRDVAMGMALEEHSCGRLPHGEGEAFDCDCETDEHSTSSCDGCGSTLHGERHAFTVFQN
jgi:hypothetical protein